MEIFIVCLTSICVVLSLFINACLADIVFEKPNSSGMVDIIYDHDLPYKKSQYKKTIDGCYHFYKSTGKQVWRCREHMLMIRPITAIQNWLNLERKLGYILFSVKEMGVLNAHGHIKLILSLRDGLNPPEKYSKNSSIVTGLSIRHTFDVGCYTFRVKKTGQINTMNVTPNHPFYVKNRGEFVPISKVMPEDLLVSETGESISLVDVNDHAKQCDGRINSTPVTVYNIELYRKHTYFAGDSVVLVHNGCSLKRYFQHLKEKGFVYPKEENSAESIHIKVPTDSVKELAWTDLEKDFFSKARRGLHRGITLRLNRLGFKIEHGMRREKGFRWNFNYASGMSVKDYGELLQYFRASKRITRHYVEAAIASRNETLSRSLFYQIASKNSELRIDVSSVQCQPPELPPVDSLSYPDELSCSPLPFQSLELPLPMESLPEILLADQSPD